MRPSLPEDAPTLGGGRFTLIGALGEGGMALVCSAWDERLQVYRALKVLLPEFAKRRSVRARFEAEARTMANLEHPNIVRIYDVGTELDLPYIAMELVMGGSLDGWLRAHGAMPPRLATHAVIQLCRGVQAAHARGVIHRDIKPHNLLVGRRDVCKLTDFGIAQLERSGTTRTGVAMGTFGYMAPEQQANAKDVDERADVYSIGATLWKLVTDGPVENLVFELSRKGLGHVTEPLQPILGRALTYDRGGRYPNVTELLGDLEAALGALPPDPADAPPLAQRDPASIPRASSDGFDAIAEILDRAPARAPARASLPYRMSVPSAERPERDETPDYIDRESVVEDAGDYVVALDEGDREVAEPEPVEAPGVLETVGVLRLVVLPALVIVAVALGLLGWAVHYTQQREQAAITARTRLHALMREDAAPAVRDVRQLGGDTRELEALYFELEEAEGDEEVVLLEQLVTSMELRLEALLPADRTQLSAEQADAVARVERLRKALTAYQRAQE